MAICGLVVLNEFCQRPTRRSRSQSGSERSKRNDADLSISTFDIALTSQGRFVRQTTRRRNTSVSNLPQTTTDYRICTPPAPPLPLIPGTTSRTPFTHIDSVANPYCDRNVRMRSYPPGPFAQNRTPGLPPPVRSTLKQALHGSLHPAKHARRFALESQLNSLTDPGGCDLPSAIKHREYTTTGSFT